VIITTNHKTDGLYLPSEDRRHFVAWSESVKEDFTPNYWNRLWRWYDSGGNRHVADYLHRVELKGWFDPKALPPRTAAFWAIVDAGAAPEDAELADALEALRDGKAKERGDNGPPAVTLDDIIGAARNDDFREWLRERKNRRIIPHRLEQCGYVAVRNDGAKDGKWKVGGQRRVIYARKGLSLAKQVMAAKDRLERRGFYDDGDDGEADGRRRRR
jgi:hypothetical protein